MRRNRPWPTPRLGQNHRFRDLPEGRFAGLNVDTEDQLGTVIHELVQNVLDHSGSQTGGVMTARAYQGEREVRLAVVDTGLGIRTSLSREGPRKMDSNLILGTLKSAGL